MRILLAASALLWLSSAASAAEADRDAMVRALIERSRLLEDVCFQIPTSLWAEYAREMAKAGPAAEPPPPLPAISEEGDYLLTVAADHTATLAASLRLRVFDPAKRASLPVLSAAWAWKDVQVNERAAELATSGGWLRLSPDKSGICLVTAKAPLKQAGTHGGSFRLDVPQTVLTLLRFEVPDAWEVALKAPRATSSARLDKGTQGLLAVASRDDLRVAYGRPMPVQEHPPRYELRGSVAWNLDAGSQQVAARLDIAIVGGRTDRIELLLPPGADGLKITGPDVREAQAASGGATVFLRDRIAEHTRLDITYSLPNTKGTIQRFGELSVRDGVWAGGTLVVTNTAGGSELLPSAAYSQKGLGSLAVPDIPRGAAALLAGAPALAYDITGRSWSAEVDVLDLGEFALRESIADLAHYELAFRPDGTMMCKASYEIRNRARQFLRLDLPRGSEILLARVNEKPAPLTPIPGAPDGYRLPLIRSTASVKGLLSFPVEVVFLCRLGTANKVGNDESRMTNDESISSFVIRHSSFLSRRGELAIPLPRIDLPVAYAWCETWLPEGLSVRRWSGALQHVEKYSSETATASLGYGSGELAEGYSEKARIAPEQAAPAPKPEPKKAEPKTPVKPRARPTPSEEKPPAKTAKPSKPAAPRPIKDERTVVEKEPEGVHVGERIGRVEKTPPASGGLPQGGTAKPIASGRETPEVIASLAPSPDQRHLETFVVPLHYGIVDVTKAPPAGGGPSKGGTAKPIDPESTSNLEGLVDKFPLLLDWPQGSSAYLDRQTNTVHIRTTRETYQKALELLDAVDKIPVNIPIKARFVDVNANDFEPSGASAALLGRNYYRAGNDFYERGDYGNAAKSFERTLALLPGSNEAANATRLLDNIKLAQGKLGVLSRSEQAAAGQVRRDIARGNEALEEQQKQLLEGGNAYFYKGDPERAKKLLEAAVSAGDQLIAQGADRGEQDARLRAAREELKRLSAGEQAKARELREQFENLAQRGDNDKALKLGIELRRFLANSDESGRATLQSELDTLALRAAKANAERQSHQAQVLTFGANTTVAGTRTEDRQKDVARIAGFVQIPPSSDYAERPAAPQPQALADLGILPERPKAELPFSSMNFQLAARGPEGREQPPRQEAQAATSLFSTQLRHRPAEPAKNLVERAELVDINGDNTAADTPIDLKDVPLNVPIEDIPISDQPAARRLGVRHRSTRLAEGAGPGIDLGLPQQGTEQLNSAELEREWSSARAKETPRNEATPFIWKEAFEGVRAGTPQAAFARKEAAPVTVTAGGTLSLPTPTPRQQPAPEQSAESANQAPAAGVEPSIRQRLAKRVSVDFHETPLADALTSLSNQTGLTILLDAEAVKADPKTVTLTAGISASSALNWVARVAGLKAFARGNAILVAAPERIRTGQPLRMYDVTDLSIDSRNFGGRVVESLTLNGGYTSTGGGHAYQGALGADKGLTNYEWGALFTAPGLAGKAGQPSTTDTDGGRPALAEQRAERVTDELRPAESTEPPSNAPVFGVADPTKHGALNRGIYSGRFNREDGQFVGGGGGTSARAESTVNAGLIWLAKAQEKDGHWDCKFWDGTASYNVGLTGLALLAFLEAGYTHTKGKYRDIVSRGLDWLRANQKPNGAFCDLGAPEATSPATRGGRARLQPSRPNGAEDAAQPELRPPQAPTSSRAIGFEEQCIAAMAVSEAYGMTRAESVRTMAQKALDFIVQTQPDHGGFGPTGAVTKRDGDMLVTGWAILAIKSAVCSELNVPVQAIDRSRVFLKNTLRRDGGSAERVRDRNSTPTATAIGLLCRELVGGNYDVEINAAARHLLEIEQNRAGQTAPEGGHKDVLVHDLTYTYFSVIAMFQMGGEHWTQWNTLFRDPLVKLQETKNILDPKGRFIRGSWDPKNTAWGAEGGRVYSTAMATLSLEVYYRFLPVYKVPARTPPPPTPPPPPAPPAGAVERVYDVRDLVQGDEAEARSLEQRVREVVGSPEAQQPYTIAYRNGRIVVVHTPGGQEQVAALLSNLREIAAPQVQAGQSLARQELKRKPSADRDFRSLTDFGGLTAHDTEFKSFVARNYGWEHDRESRLGDLAAKLERNRGQAVDVNSINLNVDARTATGLGIALNPGRNGLTYGVIDDAQFRTLLELDARRRRAGAAVDANGRAQSTIIGTDALIANGMVANLAFAADRANRLNIADNPIELPHESYVLINNGAYLTVVRAGEMQAWTEATGTVQFVEVPQDIPVPRVGRLARFEKTLLKPSEELVIRATYRYAAP